MPHHHRHQHSFLTERLTTPRPTPLPAPPAAGNYVVPPPPPPAAGEPLTLVSPMGNLYLTVEDERVAGQLLHDVYDEWDDHRQPTVSWCFSFMMLIMFMMILQSTMTVPGDGPGSAAGPGGAGGVPEPSQGGTDPAASGAAAAAGSAAVGLLAGFSLVVVWLVSKLFLVVLPLLMVMRLAARAQVSQGVSAVARSTSRQVHLSPSQVCCRPLEFRTQRAAVTAVQQHSACECPAALLLLVPDVRHCPLPCDVQEQAAEAAAAAAVGNVPGLDGSTQQGRVEVVDRDHPLVAVIARLAAARAAAQARQMGAASATAGGASSNDIEAADVEMQQARQALGRDPTFWPPAAAAAASPAQQQEGQAQSVVDAAAQRRASLRALMTAIRASALRGEVPGPAQQQQQSGASDSSAVASSRQNMV